jgi:nicotinamidase-related amidase
MAQKYLGTQNLIEREDSVLIVIDIQEKLMPVINNGERVIDNTIRLLKFSEIIGLPVVLTEQENLGDTVTEIKQEIPNLQPITKLCFNCFLREEFVEHLRQMGRKNLILTGVETHICVAQTALYAVPQFNVHLISDAVSSRTVDNWKVGIERMQQNGVVITSTEMLIFELLKEAGTDEFRAVLPLVK